MAAEYIESGSGVSFLRTSSPAVIFEADGKNFLSIFAAIIDDASIE